jgi:hypothetical protein
MARIDGLDAGDGGRGFVGHVPADGVVVVVIAPRDGQ